MIGVQHFGFVHILTWSNVPYQKNIIDIRRAQAQARKAYKAEEALEIVEEEAETAPQASGAKENEIVPVQTEHETLRDEFCSDETFEKEDDCTSEIESDEALVDKILVTADCQEDWNNEYLIKLMDDKLKTKGCCKKKPHFIFYLSYGFCSHFHSFCLLRLQFHME